MTLRSRVKEVWQRAGATPERIRQKIGQKIRQVRKSELHKTTHPSNDLTSGSDEVSATADEICIDEFGDFVGIDYETSVTLDYWVLTPSEETWAVGDREVVCTISKYDETGNVVKVTGSLEGAKE